MFKDSDNKILRIIGMVLALGKLDLKIAPADERSFQKYNASSYELSSCYKPGEIEGSTTYSLPYWMGRYHGMRG